jgi:hypothetical protein
MDEHVAALYQTELLRREPSILVWSIGTPGAPPKGTLDPDILIWCEEKGFILVTNNRSSLPVHLTDHLEQGRHVPGIFVLNRKMGIGKTLEELHFVWGAGDPAEYVDRISYLPVSR